MTKSLLGLGALLATFACSNTRETRIPARTPERPLEVARADTSRDEVPPLTRPRDTSQSVSTVEQQVTRPRVPAKTRTTHRPKQRALTPKPAPDTSGSQAYAPGSARPDPAAASDSSVGVARDTTQPASSDTTASAAQDPVIARADSATSSRPDSSTSSRPDSVARDSAAPSASETASSSTRDSARGPAAVPETAPSSDTATFGPSAADAAAARAARTLAVGTEIHAALDDSISSKTDMAGHVVTAHVMQNVTGPGGRTLIPAGAPVKLTIKRIRPSRSKGSQGALQLSVDSIAVNGRPMGLAASVKPVPRELKGRGVGAGEAAKVGVGAAGGAILGKVIGKDTKGAVIGGVIGAAGGAIVASQTTTRDVIVKPRTPVVFVLTAPLVAEQN
jgi:hypothetical protein